MKEIRIGLIARRTGRLRNVSADAARRTPSACRYTGNWGGDVAHPDIGKACRRASTAQEAPRPNPLLANGQSGGQRIKFATTAPSSESVANFSRPVCERHRQVGSLPWRARSRSRTECQRLPCPATPATGFQTRSSATRFGGISVSRSACA